MNDLVPHFSCANADEVAMAPAPMAVSVISDVRVLRRVKLSCWDSPTEQMMEISGFIRRWSFDRRRYGGEVLVVKELIGFSFLFSFLKICF